MTTKKQIAFIAPRFSQTGTVGGAETLLKNLAERAAASGHQVTMLTTCAEDHFTWENTRPAGVEKAGDLTVHYFPVDGDRDLEAFLTIQDRISRSGDVTRDEEETWMRNNVNSEALYQHLRDNGDAYDCIIPGPYLFPIVYFGSLIHPKKTLLVPCLHDESFAYLDMMNDLFGSVAGFMFNAEPEKELAQRLFDVPESKCSVVGMGLDPFEVNGQKPKDLPETYLLFSGRREPLKGTPLLMDYLDAFRQRTGHDVKLVLTGSGQVDPPPSLAPHVIDLGFVSEQRKHEAMAGALAFCHPSVNESFGIVLLESWLARTPGLVHGNSEVLKWQCQRSGGGLWFRAYPEFEEALLLLLKDEDLRTRMGEAGRNYVLEAYAWDRVEARMFEAINRVCP